MGRASRTDRYNRGRRYRPAAAHAHQDARRNPHLELVVSGPTSKVIHARRTEQVLLQLIDEAAQEILIITYALHMHEQLRTALTAATARGVTWPFL